MHLTNAFEILKFYFKTHIAAANYLGITGEHYRAIRNNRVHIPKRTADLIILKAMEVRDKATP